MPKIKRKKAIESLIVREFDGLRDDAGGRGVGASYIRNVRFTPDGALEKRPGYRLIKEFGQNIRTFWHSTVRSLPGDFVLLGSEIFYCPASGNPISFGNVGNAQGAAKFFFYRDHLYLAASCSLYICDLQGRSFSAVCGYAPIYGEDWNPATGTGEVKEPLNLISERIRVRYLCPMGTTLIRLPFPRASIQSVTANGEALAYSSGNSLTVTLASATQNLLRVEVAYTMESVWAPLRGSICSCTIPFSFRKGNKETLYLTGGQSGFKAYCSAHVSDESFSECAACFPDSDPLYFKASGVLLLGDQSHPLTAFVRQNNRVIAFGTSGAWSITHGAEGDTVESYPLESCPGCVSREGALSVGDELLVVTASGLCSLKAYSNDKDRFAVELLTGTIRKILGDFKWSSALLLYHSIQNLILLRDTSETGEGLVYLYDRSLKNWTCWNRVKAADILSLPDGTLLFWQEKKVFVFDEALHSDLGRTFDWIYESGAISFDSPEEWKRSLRIFCEVSGDENEELDLTISSERTTSGGCWYCEESAFPSHFECRLPTGRFRNVSYRLNAIGSGQIKIHRLGCYCKL